MKRMLLYNGDGHEVRITYPCRNCGRTLDIQRFGLRKTSRGLRNLSVCGQCRGRWVSQRQPSQGTPTHEVAHVETPSSP